MDRNLLNSFPQVRNPKPEYAILARLDGKRTFRFLTMPPTLNTEKSARYPSISAQNDKPIVAWGGNEPEIMNLDLPLSGYPDRDLTKYLEDLKSLMEPDSDKISPPALVWRWGGRRFSPCLLVRVTVRETLWFANGQIQSAIASISLIKTREDLLVT